MVSKDNTNPLVEEGDLGYGELFAVLWRRRFWMVGSLCVSVALAAIVAIREKPVYQSSMQLLVEPNYPSSQAQSDLISGSSSPNSQEDYATQINLMRSGQFMQKAVQALQSEYSDLSVDEVSRSLNLIQILEDEEKTKIFKAVYTGDDPKKTQRVLETLQKIYQDYNLQQQELRLNRGLATINKQIEESRENLVMAQGALEQFLSKHGLVQPEQQASSALGSLNEIQQTQQTTRTEYDEARARYLTLQQQLALSPQAALITARLSQSERYQFLLGELQKTDFELARRRVIYTELSPAVRSLAAQRQTQIRLLQEEVSRIVGTVAAQSELDPDRFLRNGQLSPTDITLVGQLVELQSTLSGLAARSQSLATAERRIQSQASRFPALIAEYERLQPQVESERANLQKLLQLRQELSARLVQGGFNWQVVEAPGIGDEFGPKASRTILLGVVVGLFLGGAAAFLRESTDTVIHSVDDLQKQSKLPLLGALPDLNPSARSLTGLKRLQTGWVSNTFKKWGLLQEFLDLSYKNIQILSSSSDFNSIVITSALPGEGKSTVAVGLALSAARLHQKVLLIDANLRHPTLHQHFQIPNEQGLSTLLSDGAIGLQPLQLSLLGLGIDFIPAGAALEDPVRLLSSRLIKEAILDYEARYDLILIDTPSALGTVDTLQIASICKGILLVSSLDQVTKPELHETIALLNKLNVIGILANRCPNVAVTKRARPLPIRPDALQPPVGSLTEL